MITSEQSRAARALLGMSQGELAALSGVAKRSIASFEVGDRTPYDVTIDKLQKALESAGVQFLESGNTALGTGVALKKPATD